MQGSHKSSFAFFLFSEVSVGAPGQGKAEVSKLLLPSVEPKDPPGMVPLLFGGSKGNEAVSMLWPFSQDGLQV